MKESIDVPVIIIDDFYADLSWLAEHLSSHHTVRRLSSGVNYAGIVYPPPYQATLYAQEKIKVALGGRTDLSFLGQGEIRRITSEDQHSYHTFVHTDPSWNVIIYLDGKEGENEGTYFYRHKDLKIICLPDDRVTLNKLNLLIPSDSKDLSRWEIIKQISFRKNRAVIFDGKYFHSVPPVISSSRLDGGRITQNFFLTMAATE